MVSTRFVGGVVGSNNDSSDLITQEDTIFVAGMNTESTEEEIATHFGAIGIIKVSAQILNN